MSPTLRRAALRRLVFRATLCGALLVAGVAALLPSTWLGPEPVWMRLTLIGTAVAVGTGVALLAMATKKRPRVTGPVASANSPAPARFVA